MIDSSYFSETLEKIKGAPNSYGWRSFFYELIQHLIGSDQAAWEGLLPLFKAVESSEELASILTDTIWVTDLQVESPELIESRRKLGEILYSLLETGLIPTVMAKERLEPELLELAKAIQSAAIFNKKQIKVNTALLYKQQKFNLLHEESEGFAKLIFTISNWPVDPEGAPALYQSIVSLIGYFDLDPTRVLDLILDVFAISFQGKSGLFLELFKLLAFPAATITSVLAFKLPYIAKAKNDAMFQGIGRVIALLVKHGIIQLDQIYHCLTGSDKECQEMIAARRKNILSASRKVGMVSLASSSDAAPPPVTPSTPAKPGEKQGAAEPFVPAALGYQEPKGALLEFDDKWNQKANLLVALLELGETGKAEWLLGRLPRLPSLSMAAAKSICLHIRSDVVRSTDSATLLKWLEYVGPSVYLDAVLLTRLCRWLKGVKDDGVYETVLYRFILPGISLNAANPSLSWELWDLISAQPYIRRYALYRRWKEQVHSDISLHSEVALARAMTMNDIKKVMRRLAKENVKQFGRLIGKISHCNPTVFFPIVLDQLQSYDNLIQPVVESLKYVTPLAFDVLTYTMIEALANPERDRLKEDGTNLSSWLQNLAMFAGCLFKKYSAVDIAPVLQYIVNQLKDDNTFDLIILSELMQKMAGSESSENMTEAELYSLAAGPILKGEVYAQQHPQAAAMAKTLKRSSQRLMQGLSASQLAIPLWILLAKFSVAAVYKTDISHLKLLGSLTDTCHHIFIQFSQFICQHAIESGLALGDVPVRLEDVPFEYERFIRRSWERTHTGKSNLELLLARLGQKGSDALNLAIEPCLVEGFWMFELEDLLVPMQLYTGEIARLKGILQTGEPPILMSEQEKTKWLKDKERAPRMIQSLEGESKVRQGLIKLTLNWIHANAKAFFAPGASRTAIIDDLLKMCIFPRCLFSPADALYAAKFIGTLHGLAVDGFSSLSCYDRIIGQVAGLIFTFTEREAHCYGRFLEEILVQLHKWHASSAVYEAEAIGEGRPGFYQRWAKQSGAEGLAEEEKAQEDIGGPEMVDSVESPIDADSSMDAPMAEDSTPMTEQTQQQENIHLSYEDYRHVLYKWHLKLHKAFASALESGDYQHIRNSIIILSYLVPGHFPALRKVGASLEKILGKVQAQEEGKREDLKLLAVRCLSMLLARKGAWVPEDQFHHVPKAPEPVATAGSEKRSSEEQLSGRVKRLKIEEKEKGGSPSGKSPQEIEKELRKKLEERKAASSQEKPQPSRKLEPAPRSERESQREPQREQRDRRGSDRERERPREAAPRESAPPSRRDSPRDYRASGGRSDNYPPSSRRR